MIGFVKIFKLAFSLLILQQDKFYRFFIKCILLCMGLTATGASDQ